MRDDARIRAFLSKYPPGIATQLRNARARLRRRFPRGHELVYDNYNALVFGFGPTERSSEAILSVAGYPKWITLFFLRGAGLPDPDGLLGGKGKQVRSIRLRSAEHLDEPGVRALIDHALAPHASALREAPRLRTIVKSVSAKQRPRRPAS